MIPPIKKRRASREKRKARKVANVYYYANREEILAKQAIYRASKLESTNPPKK